MATSRTSRQVPPTDSQLHRRQHRQVRPPASKNWPNRAQKYTGKTPVIDVTAFSQIKSGKIKF
ncbi:hypothetical protein ACSBR2_036991 [Camellia fascicularis]